MAPINLPDGTEVSEVILPDGSTASEVIAPDGTTVFGAIPDSVVSREQDDTTNSGQPDAGLRFEVTNEWPEIGARLSANVANFDTAEIYRISSGSNGERLGQTDISNLTNGDTFTVNLSSNLVSGETYAIYVGNSGGDHTQGYYSSASFPITSSDGNLSLTEGVTGDNKSQGVAYNMIELGDVGF